MVIKARFLKGAEWLFQQKPLSVCIYQITLAPIWFSQLNNSRIDVVSVCSLAGKVSQATWPSDIQECKDKWFNLLQRYS